MYEAIGDCGTPRPRHAFDFCESMTTIAEVLQGSYGPKCDMWSMGVISYMMVSGAPPFWGNGDAQVGFLSLVACF